MDNFSITHTFYSDAPNLTRLIMFTNNPCHLFAYKTGSEPVLTTHWDLIRGLALKCIPKWRIMNATVREQNEAGDTTLHTINLPGWRPGQTYWIVTLGTIGGSNSPSIGPILSHVNAGGTIYNHTRFPSSPGDLIDEFWDWPRDNPHWQAIDEDPPDENASYLRATKTLGPFPVPVGGELYHLNPVPSPQKYYLINELELWHRIKAANWGWPWQCNIKWASFASQLKLHTGETIIEAPQFTWGWRTWANGFDDWEQNPFTERYWFYPELENIQIGMQMRQVCSDAVRYQTYCTQLKFVIKYWGEAPGVYP